MSVASDRRAIEATYTDKCSVFRFENVKKSGITSQKKLLQHESIRCALSQKTLRPTTQTDSVNRIAYDAKLFLAPELQIDPGSHIEVSRFGRMFSYESSGEAFVYETHQEVMLLRKDKA